MPGFSERIPQHQLNIPLRVFRRDLAERRAGWIEVRRIPDRMLVEVEELRSELKVVPLG